ncbi:hypothetical protein APSETT445_005221 [Aspergillus pseudonomiae]
MRLVANELLRIYGEEKPIYCLSGWPQSVYDIGWAARLEKNTGAHGRNWLNYSSYLLLDEAQLLYWHDSLWSEFFESVEPLGDSWVLAGKNMRKLRSTLPPNSKSPYILKVALDLSPPRWRPVGLLLSEDEAEDVVGRVAPAALSSNMTETLTHELKRGLFACKIAARRIQEEAAQAGRKGALSRALQERQQDTNNRGWEHMRLDKERPHLQARCDICDAAIKPSQQKIENAAVEDNNGGVVISLSALKQLELSENKSMVGLGPGLKWLDVYRGLDAHEVAVTGGRVTTVGVSGLLLGGGISFHSHQYGVSAMGICNYEVVLANSQIVNANAQENADLFWALKGGGPNFGVVTKLDMTTIPSKHWSEVRIYPITATDQVLEAMMQYHAAIEDDDKSSLIYNATHDIILVVFFYGAPVEYPPIFQSFYDIPYVTSFVAPGIRTVYDLMNAVDSVQDPEPALHEFRTMTSLPSLDVYRAIEKTHAEQVNVLKDVEGITLTTVIQPMPSSAMKATLQSPLGLTPVGQQWFLVRADWKNAKDEELVREAVRKIIDAAELEAKQAGVYLPYLYSNYASRDQDPLASYGVENAKRLQEIALKYDPDGVFQTLQNGGWLLSNMGLDH